MRIALIRPGLGLRGNSRYRSRACLQPLALALLAGLTPSDVQVEAFDDRFEEMPYDQPWDLVALSVGSYQARRAYEIANGFRRRGTRVILGGFHPSLCPDEAALYADSVAIGEAEGLWPEIVKDLRRGALKPVYQRDCRPDLSGLKPDHSVLCSKAYAPVNVIQFGRGCPHGCDFCSVRAFYQGAMRYRPVREVTEELEHAPHRWTFFADDNMVGQRDLAKKLMREIKPLGVRWMTQASLDLVDDVELLQLMAAGGCQCLIIGLESLNNKNMKQMGKSWAGAADYARKLARIRELGIMVYATFVFGYDEDDPGVFDRTLDFAMKQKFFLVNFNHLQPFPGTRLFERLKEEGRLLYDRWWMDSRYRFGTAVFHPKLMTAHELTEGARRVRHGIHGYRRILQRFPDRRTNASSISNALTYFLVNLGSRQDILNKHGLTLGMELSPPEILPRRTT